MTAPAISVLICTRDRPEPLLRCVRSILAGDCADFELIVVDQSATDAGRRLLAGITDPRLQVIATPTRGQARARNLALRAARAPYLLFTDDDCIADHGWIGAVLREFAAEPEVDAIYGRVLPYGDGAPGEHCATVMTATERYHVRRLQASTHEALGHGNNMAFRRRCFERHGLYMEWLGPGTWATGADDTDFTFRLLRAGAGVLYSPDPLVWHDNWRPIEQSNRQLYGYMFSASAVFTRYALRGSGVAARVQLRFLRGYLKDLLRALRWRSWRAVRHHARLLRAFAGGGLFGALCVLRRPPRL